MWSRKFLIYTSRINDNKRIKMTMRKLWTYRNFQVYILTSKWRFHKFWNFDPSLDVIIAKIRSKRTKFSCLVRKVIDELNWSQNETKMKYQIYPTSVLNILTCQIQIKDILHTNSILMMELQASLSKKVSHCQTV